MHTYLDVPHGHRKTIWAASCVLLNTIICNSWTSGFETHYFLLVIIVFLKRIVQHMSFCVCSVNWNNHTLMFLWFLFVSFGQHNHSFLFCMCLGNCGNTMICLMCSLCLVVFSTPTRNCVCVFGELRHYIRDSNGFRVLVLSMTSICRGRVFGGFCFCFLNSTHID